MELVAKQFGTGYESSFVRTTSLVLHFAIAYFRDNRMADREQRQELVGDVTFGTSADLREIDERILFSSDERAQVGERTPGLLVVFAVPTSTLVNNVRICNPADRTKAELHLVTGERSGLVAKDILDLTKLLDKRRRTTERRGVCLRIVHIQIGIDELSLLKLDHLHRHNEGDRNQVVVQDDERQDVCLGISEPNRGAMRAKTNLL